MSQLRICIVAHNAYGMIVSDKSRHIGGVELQTASMARWLAKRGHAVSLITWHEGGPAIETIAGVRVVKTCSRDKGLPIVRFFVPRWSSLLTALSEADADIYYQNGAEYVTGQVAVWCRKSHRKFVFSVASDVECYKSLPGFSKFREIWFYRLGLRLADEIIVQTQQQARLLKSEFDVDADVLPMPCHGPAKIEASLPQYASLRSKTVLFVGRLANVKRIELLLDVAQLCPDIDFLMVGGGNRDTEYAGSMEARANELDNVTLYGRADRDELMRIYATASLLICTSKYEGFPNTFLEAWSHGLPIVSTVDPDDLIARHRLGKIAIDAHSLAEGLRFYIDGEESNWSSHSANARQYYLSNHAPDVALQRFESIFGRVVKDV